MFKLLFNGSLPKKSDILPEMFSCDDALPVNMTNQFFQFRCSDGKRAMTMLPYKIFNRWKSLFYPFRGGCIDRFDQRRDCVFPWKSKGQMYMVFNPAHPIGNAIVITRNRCEVGTNRQAYARNKQRLAIPGTENQMNNNAGQGLWHGGNDVDASLQPANWFDYITMTLPWAIMTRAFSPQNWFDYIPMALPWAIMTWAVGPSCFFALD
jgi:hypothetical protein